MDEEALPPMEHDVILDDTDDDRCCADGGAAGDELNTSSTSTLAKSSTGGDFGGGAIFSIYKEDSAPVDFQVPSSDSEDDENFDQLLTSPTTTPFLDKVPCPLCKRKRQRLTCQECLKKGDFYVQNNNNYYRNVAQSKERYSELMSKFAITQRTLATLKKQCSLYTDKKGRIARISDEIDTCQATITLQNQLRISMQAKILNANKESATLKTKTAEKLTMYPVFRKRLDNMKSQYVHNCTKLKRFHEEVQKRQESLKRGTKSRVIQLRHHVFPIEEVNQGNRSGSKGLFGTESWSDEEDDTVRSLMVAKSNYWSRPDELVSSFGTCFSITGPLGPNLPCSGDYSAYNMWVERNQTPSGVTSGASTYRNPAHSIAAALTYTTQFVNLIAYYLDLRLPHRLSYSEFRNGDLVHGKFNKKVAKLNANVIHLCSSQGIHATSLQPRKTISNLLLLFDPEQADLGRRGPFEVASQLAKSMEDSIEKDLVIYEEGSLDSSDNEWSESTFPSDWETINRAAICEEFSLQEMKAAEIASPTAFSYGTDSIYRSSSSNSLAGAGLFSSVTSFFRGWNK